MAEIQKPFVVATGKREPLSLQKARDFLAPFLSANPTATIAEVPQSSGKRPAIHTPWGDNSLVILIPDEVGPFVEAMNNLYLPPRFTAVWHSDVDSFEVIWTAYHIPPVIADMSSRSFVFQHKGNA